MVSLRPLGLGLVGRRRCGQGIVIGDYVARNAFSQISTTADNPPRLRLTGTDAGQNPRASRLVTGLTSGASYRAVIVFRSCSTADNTHFRVDDINGPVLDDGSYLFTEARAPASTGNVNLDFTAPANGSVYIGIVAIATATVEIDYAFSSLGLV
jgi:hypothetical protein